MQALKVSERVAPPSPKEATCWTEATRSSANLTQEHRRSHPDTKRHQTPGPPRIRCGSHRHLAVTTLPVSTPSAFPAQKRHLSHVPLRKEPTQNTAPQSSPPASSLMPGPCDAQNIPRTAPLPRPRNGPRKERVERGHSPGWALPALGVSAPSSSFHGCQMSLQP